MFMQISHFMKQLQFKTFLFLVSISKICPDMYFGPQVIWIFKLINVNESFVLPYEVEMSWEDEE